MDITRDENPEPATMKDASRRGLGWRELDSCTINDRPSRRFLLFNAHGLEVELLEHGASVYSASIRANDGRTIPLTRGLKSPASYASNPAYMGSVCGRYAGRIAHAQFSFAADSDSENGGVTRTEGAEPSEPEQLVTLTANDGRHHLHGGRQGFDARAWSAEPVQTQEEVGVIFRYTSDAGEEGYPGRLACEVRYSMDESSTLLMTYAAQALDCATVVNLTNHCYWNLSDQRSALSHLVQINAQKVLEFGPDLLPSGVQLSVRGGPFDFREPRELRQALDQLGQQVTTGDSPAGFDHCFVAFERASSEPGLNPASPRRPASTTGLTQVAEVWAPDSGRGMRVYTDQPALVFYTGNFLDGSDEVGGHQRHEAFCLECQQFPDAPNQPSFPSVRIESGQTYRQQTAYQLLFPSLTERVTDDAFG